MTLFESCLKVAFFSPGPPYVFVIKGIVRRTEFEWPFRPDPAGGAKQIVVS